jgi:hypothetical protein
MELKPAAVILLGIPALVLANGLIDRLRKT